MGYDARAAFAVEGLVVGERMKMVLDVAGNEFGNVEISSGVMVLCPKVHREGPALLRGHVAGGTQVTAYSRSWRSGASLHHNLFG